MFAADVGAGIELDEGDREVIDRLHAVRLADPGVVLTGIGLALGAAARSRDRERASAARCP